MFQTTLFRLPVWAYSKTAGRLLGSKSGVRPDEPLLQNGDITISSPQDHADEVIDAATSPNQNAEFRKRKLKAKSRNR